MISHICIGISDFTRALAFYQPLMETLGLAQRFVDPARPWAGWQAPGRARPLFLIAAPYDGRPASAGNGQMVALLAPDRPTVDAAYRIALAQGGRCEGAPGLRGEYHPDYYGAYVRDPDGNKLCFCCHDGPGVPIQA